VTVVSKIIVWLIVGGLAGSAVGAVVNRKKEGRSFWRNLWVGLLGALIGGAIFHVFKIDLGLGQIQVTLEDVVAAILGSVLLLVGLWIYRKTRKPKPAR
jgi:uncharacterized membrane protein YeaQ/YmgE (transglycosylase-associated protein family)